MTANPDNLGFGIVFGTAYTLLVVAYFVWVFIELHRDD